MSTGERVRDLRKALMLSQSQLAAKTKGEVSPVYLQRVESGKNKGTSWKVRSGLAQGFGLPVADLDDYLEGRITMRDALHRIRHPQPIIEAPPEPSDDAPDDEFFKAGVRRWEATLEAVRTPSLDKALGLAFDSATHELRDVDAVRAALRNYRKEWDPKSLARLARRWLDIAAKERERETHGHIELTIEELLLSTTDDLESRIEFMRWQLKCAGLSPIEVGAHDIAYKGIYDWPRNLFEQALAAMQVLPAKEAADLWERFPAFAAVQEQSVDLPMIERLRRAIETDGSAWESRVRKAQGVAAEAHQAIDRQEDQIDELVKSRELTPPGKGSKT